MDDERACYCDSRQCEICTPDKPRAQAGGITIVVDPRASWTIAGRSGAMYAARIVSLSPASCSMDEIRGRLIGVEVAGLGRIVGVEMFCIDQHVGMPIGVLVNPTST